jgi:hypothetical protein
VNNLQNIAGVRLECKFIMLLKFQSANILNELIAIISVNKTTSLPKMMFHFYHASLVEVTGSSLQPVQDGY